MSETFDFMDGIAQAELVRSKEVTPVELLEAAIDRQVDHRRAPEHANARTGRFPDARLVRYVAYGPYACYMRTA